jgi:phosphate transport system substrate-binding protein
MEERSMRSNRIVLLLAMLAALALAVAACGEDEESTGGGNSANAEESSSEELSGSIRIDGSSTVFPFAEAAGELFNEEQPGVQVTVGQSGTGGGFEKFCAGETDISSRPIKEDEEVPVCEKAGVKFEEIQIANDGIAVVTNKALTVDCLTVPELKKIWGPKSKDDTYTLFGPGTDSGTFDFFTDVINGEEGASREDYEASEDDNQLVTGVSGTENGLGYFGFSYYEQNQDKLNLVAVDGGDGCVKPSAEAIQDGSYKPLSRPLFMYPSDKALERPEVKAFMEFVVTNQQAIAEAAQFVSLTDEQAADAKTKVDALAGS